jgi:hypothetical protein
MTPNDIEGAVMALPMQADANQVAAYWTRLAYESIIRFSPVTSRPSAASRSRSSGSCATYPLTTSHLMTAKQGHFPSFSKP